MVDLLTLTLSTMHSFNLEHKYTYLGMQCMHACRIVFCNVLPNHVSDSVNKNE